MLILNTAFTAIQTFWCALLPFAQPEFNISISEATQIVCVEQNSGKVIKQSPIPEKDYRIKTVVIDAGHGGHDPGCLGSFSHEKDVALAIAKNVAIFIATEYPDIKVIMTRDDDFFVPLFERTAIANRNNADLFISIHCNFMPGNSNTKGSETYVMGLHTAEHNLAVAKRENAAILLEEDYKSNYDFDPNSPEAHILLSMFQNAHLDQSILLAERVENAFKMDNRKSRGVRQAGFYVLKATTMPSILIETGFLSNREEETYLNTPEGQQTVATSILNAFTEYKNSVELGGTPFAPTSEMKPSLAEKPIANVAPPLKMVENPTNAGNSRLKPQTKTTTKPVNTKPIEPTDEPKVIPISNAKELIGNSAVQFCIQLAAATKPVDPSQAKWSNLPYAIESVQEGNLYKYQARGFSDFESALRAKINLKNQGFPDAFLVAYKNGIRISIDDAKRELGIQY